jgi:hypothetical protein
MTTSHEVVRFGSLAGALCRRGLFREFVHHHGIISSAIKVPRDPPLWRTGSRPASAGLCNSTFIGRRVTLYLIIINKCVIKRETVAIPGRFLAVRALTNAARRMISLRPLSEKAFRILIEFAPLVTIISNNQLE